MGNIAVIPAYNPDRELIELIGRLCAIPETEIIVVNDGSNQKTLSIFNSISNKVTLLSHPVNQGKGAAIKTALRHIHRQKKECNIVCMDADGQHSSSDAQKLLEGIKINPDCLMLGVRTFSDDIPWKSRWGNRITKLVFRLLSGIRVSDTQTGLRAFSHTLIPFLLEVTGNRYEYEMNVLSSCARQRVCIMEVPVQTIYNDQKNTCSHFRAIRDSVRIYGNLLMFAGSSFVCFILDYLVFFPMIWMFELFAPAAAALVLGNIAARIISASFNYYLNSTFVFVNGVRIKTIGQYFLLAVCIIALNTLILYFFTQVAGIQRGFAKIATEILLFALSFAVQKLLIFKNTPTGEK